MAAPSNGALPSPRTPSIWPPPKAAPSTHSQASSKPPPGGGGGGAGAVLRGAKTYVVPETGSLAGSAVSSTRGTRVVPTLPGATLPPGISSRRGLRSLAAKLSRLLGESKHAATPVSVSHQPLGGEVDTAGSGAAQTDKNFALNAATLAKFDADELDVLRKIYKELNLRSPDEGIDKETFQQYFPLPGLWGERLFHEFDAKKTGKIDYATLMDGLAKCCRGTKLEKMQVLFDMFDLDGDGFINREELTLLLSNVPKLENYIPERLGISRTNSKTGLVHLQVPREPNGFLPDVDNLFWVSRRRKSSSSSSSLTSHECWDREEPMSGGDTQQPQTDRNGAMKCFCSTTSWRTSLSGGESPRVAHQELRAAESGDLEEEERFLFGAGPSPMVAELLAKAQSEELGPSSMVDLEAIVDHILEDYDTLDSSALSFSGFKSFLEHHPQFLRLFSDSLREEVWALQGHAIYRPQRGLPTFSSSVVAPAHRPASVVSSRPDQTSDLHLQPINAGAVTVSGLHANHLGTHTFAEDTVEMNNLEKWIKIQQLFTRHAAPKQMMNSPPSTIPVSKTPVSKSASPSNTEGQESAASKQGDTASRSPVQNEVRPKHLLPPLPSEGAVYPRHSRYSGSREVLDFLEVSLGQYASDEDEEPPVQVRDNESRLDFGVSEGLADNRLPIWQENKNPLSCPHCHAPLLVCPKCDRRYPVLRMQGSHLVVECQQCMDSKAREFASCWVCLWPFNNAFDMINHHDVLMEGTLWKLAKQSKKWVDRYFVLVDRLLYYYSKQTDSVPKGFVFLEGCFVDPISTESPCTSDVASESPTRRYGFCIIHAGGSFSRRELFAQDEQTRDRWLAALRSALNQQPIDQLFQLEEIIGQGKFSIVYKAIEKATNMTYAIKVINKSRMTQHEKDLLRGEMSILRLLRHPHVIYLKSLVATREVLHIIMELVPGGELFDAIAIKGHLSETVVNRLTCQLLKTLVYLHKAGIVHRDLKPENILLTNKDVDKADVKIADFGLSCLCGPTEKLFQPCGTLVYVAPEVLTLQGYSHPVDLWSLGVIVYLLLAGRLPFPIMRNSGMSVLTEREKFYRPKFDSLVWRNVSRSAQDFISKLLELRPERRMTASESLNHIWIKNPSAVLKDVTPKPTENPASARASKDTAFAVVSTSEQETSAPMTQILDSKSRLLVRTQSEESDRAETASVPRDEMKCVSAQETSSAPRQETLSVPRQEVSSAPRQEISSASRQELSSAPRQETSSTLRPETTPALRQEEPLGKKPGGRRDSKERTAPETLSISAQQVSVSSALPPPLQSSSPLPRTPPPQETVSAKAAPMSRAGIPKPTTSEVEPASRTEAASISRNETPLLSKTGSKRSDDVLLVPRVPREIFAKPSSPPRLASARPPKPNLPPA
eukprot:Gregarina_sp_Poly_1__212@NODE_104_length_14336_cov_169_911977_g91_i0_p2_GENE_NODE_104_length_14336_cov_169_911977_g91_i0NODE_104_length_14336_cov_169_911977_g91_i0_p2_ORF_typecomplete_len1399_score245_74Pkinase/PF00069_25/1_2e72Pkinase_Tyr/PF07714_17/1_8e44PH/PF00169_29/9_9e18Kinaselike/PF14531_6/2_9e16Kdo/PF06293_14/5_5e11EFhand_1/PF00036_32/0_84EFhand_1/PF00036_32/1_1e05EFhand_7/PF13499_6/4_7e08EFhand_7/PF13499_6/3_9e03Pkinase_fungal/PF17667_1/6_6e03Pkinase_fungal/PF17667_1/7_4e08EFhand_6/PF13